MPDQLVKGKGTVLLVDDEEMVLEAGKELLNHLGYEVLPAENGRETMGLFLGTSYARIPMIKTKVFKT